MFLLNFQLGKLPLERSESFHCTLLMQKPSIDALMTMTLLNIGSATVTRSGITTHQHTFTLIPQDLPNACTRSHTEVQTHTHTQSEKRAYCEYKNKGGLFQRVLQKVTRTYQRLRHKAAFLKPTDTSTSNRWWCSCFYRHTWYRKIHTDMLQYSKRAF